MTSRTNKVVPGIILATGAIWGLVEFGVGMGLQQCAALYTGAILTGLSFFWLSFIRSLTRKVAPLLVIAGIAMLLKWLDAWLLHVAWNHGSVLNPMFAFLTALAGFALFSYLFRNGYAGKLRFRVMTGAGAALIAVLLFPLVKFVTGTPACYYGTTGIPMVFYASPVSIAISMVTVPLGHWVAKRVERVISNASSDTSHTVPGALWSPAVCALCILIVVLARVL